jgi:hypothetical protein
MARLRLWQLSLLLIAACALVVGSVGYFYWRSTESNEWLFRRLPAQGALIAGVDVKALRESGFLDALAGGITEEADYTRFVSETGFDYRRDLDYVAIAWTSDRRDILARGRFDWRLLSEYALSRSGSCRNMFCEVEGSVATRKISFFPAARNVMGVSVGRESGGVWALTEEKPSPRLGTVRSEPVWISMGPEWLESSQYYPAGLRAFLSALGGASRITFALDSAGTANELRLEAACDSPGKAGMIHQRLSEATSLLRSMIARQGLAANPNDLSGVLSSGAFELKDSTVHGRWTLTREFLSKLAGGAL